MTSRGLDRIGSDECIELLRRTSFGRIGIRISDEPVIFPVFYVVAEDQIVFRTDPGTKLIAAVLETRVAFEVDDADAGWSVLVIGHAHEMHAPSATAIDSLARLDGFWPEGERQHIVQIAMEKIEGRRLRRQP